MRYQGIVGYPLLQALLNFSTSVYDIFPQIYAFFVATHVYALLYWAFPHRFTHNLVAFSRKRRLRAFVKILAGSLFFLAGSLFSFPCLSQILSSTPGGHSASE